MSKKSWLSMIVIMLCVDLLLVAVGGRSAPISTSTTHREAEVQGLARVNGQGCSADEDATVIIGISEQILTLGSRQLSLTELLKVC